MKKLLLILFILISFISKGQSPFILDTSRFIPNSGAYSYKTFKIQNLLILGTDTLLKNPGITRVIGSNLWYVGSDMHWHKASDSTSPALPGNLLIVPTIDSLMHTIVDINRIAIVTDTLRGGTFLYKTGADYYDGITPYRDTGIVIPANPSGMWVRQRENEKDVYSSWFGNQFNTFRLSKLDPGSNFYLNPKFIYSTDTSIVISKPINIYGQGTLLKGISVGKMIDIRSDSVRIENMILDLTSTSLDGIRHDSLQPQKHVGMWLKDLTIKNQYPTAGNNNGAISIANFSNIYTDNIYVEHFNNYALMTPPERAFGIKFVACENVYSERFKTYSVGVGVNTFRSTNINFHNFYIDSANNNGFYIQLSRKVSISNGYVGRAQDAGIVMKNYSDYNTRNEESGMIVTNVIFQDCPLRAFALRQGDGAVVTNNTFIRCGGALSQTSDYPKTRGIIFSDNVIYNCTSDGGAIRVFNASFYQIHNNTIFYTDTSLHISKAIRFNIMDSSSLENNLIYGNSSIEDGISISLTKDCIVKHNRIFGVFGKHYEQLDPTNNVGLILEDEGELTGQNQTFINNPLLGKIPTLTLKQVRNSYTTADTLGKIRIQNNDPSFDDLATSFEIQNVVTSSNGRETKVNLLIDSLMFMNINHDGQITITNPVTIPKPTLSSHAATKSYADSIVASISFYPRNLAYGGLGENLDDIANSGYYPIDGSATGVPLGGGGYLYSARKSSTQASQLFLTASGSKMYFRAKNTTWSTWIALANAILSMTKVQRDALVSPANGLMVYQTDNTPGLRVRENGIWVKYTSTPD